MQTKVERKLVLAQRGAVQFNGGCAFNSEHATAPRL